MREQRENAPPQPPRAVSEGELVTVDPSQVTTEQHRQAGPIHVGYQFLATSRS